MGVTTGTADAPRPRPARGRPSPRAVAAVVAVTLAAGLAAVGVASLLDEPVDGAARDRAPIIVGQVVPPGQELTGAEDRLPQLAMVLDRPAPDGISRLAASDQIVRLREIVASEPAARRYVELGRAHMELDDIASARESFTRARALAPADPAPLVGLAMTQALEGDAGLDRAASDMRTLTDRFPGSQLAWFNRGWLAVYRSDADTAITSWTRTVALGRGTPLGRAAAGLLAEIGRTGSP